MYMWRGELEVGIWGLIASFDREREREGTFIIALSAEKVRLKLIDKK